MPWILCLFEVVVRLSDVDLGRSHFRTERRGSFDSKAVVMLVWSEPSVDRMWSDTHFLFELSAIYITGASSLKISYDFLWYSIWAEIRSAKLRKGSGESKTCSISISHDQQLHRLSR